MVEFDDMSYNTLQKAIKKKFKMELPDKGMAIEEEMKQYPDRFEELNCNYKWVCFSPTQGYIEIINDTWNYPNINGIMFHIVLDGKHHDIIRRKQD